MRIGTVNTTINSATGVSPHYAITGRHLNIGLLKLLSKELASNDPGAYGMQINALLRQVHHRVALTSNKARLNRFVYKDPIQVGDKVLLHRPQSTIAQSSNIPWIGDFKVIKTNNVMSQVQNKNGDRAWIHRAHIHCLKPQPAHTRSCITLTKTLRIPHLHLPFKSHNFTQNSTLNNIPSQPPQNEAKQMPIRLTRGQIPACFKDYHAVDPSYTHFL